MDSHFTDEAGRIRAVYARRDRVGMAKLYSWNQPDAMLNQYLLRSTIAGMLTEIGWNELSGKEYLDVGCGVGAWLRTLQEWGAEPSRLHGIDLLADRIDKARCLAPQIDFQVSEGWPLLFPSGSMDLVSAHTVFSSILAPDARQNLAKEMMRVLRPQGIVLLYDFRISHPQNFDTIGIGSREIRRLFIGSTVKRRLLTLAPPLQRRLAQLSPLLAHLVEVLFPFLRTHAIYVLNWPAKDAGQ